jgi:ribosomal-protein-alanine N-acetyltransferase
MGPDSCWTIRSAQETDRERISNLISVASWRHQHLDWFTALDLIGQGPFLVALADRQPVACLACTPDSPQVAWLRVVAIASGVPLSRIWDDLWPPAESQLRSVGAAHVAALPSSEWLAPLLKASGFVEVNQVVFLEWSGLPPQPDKSFPGLRALRSSDLAAVASLDQRAFAPLWQLSKASLAKATGQAAVASVIEHEGRVMGYQVSTASAFGAHLARLAVDPALRRQGAGAALTLEAIRGLARRGFQRVTVNTQTDNEPSLRLYESLGFRRINQSYPVYQLDLTSARRRAQNPASRAGH